MQPHQPTTAPSPDTRSHAAIDDLVRTASNQAAVTSLLRLLDTPTPQASRDIADRTVATVAQRTSPVNASLSEDDADALDALALEGFAAHRVPGALRERAERVMSLLSLAGGEHRGEGTEGELPTIATARREASLVERTLAQVERARIATPIEPMQLRGGRGGLRMRDLFSAAAVLAMGSAVLWPMFAAASSRASKVGCSANLATLAGAFGQYGSDFRDNLPVASEARAGAVWWDVGTQPERSNSANFFTLHRAGYAPLDASCCGGNPHACRTLTRSSTDWRSLDEVSYSYFVMFAQDRPTMTTDSRTIILADRSPVIRNAIAGRPVFVNQNSTNHGGEGQWVLRLDGSGDWLATPNDLGPGRAASDLTAQGADNIWLPAHLEEVLAQIQTQVARGATSGAARVPTRERGLEMRAIRLQGTESPASATDAFLGP